MILSNTLQDLSNNLGKKESTRLMKKKLKEEKYLKVTFYPFNRGSTRPQVKNYFPQSYYTDSDEQGDTYYYVNYRREGASDNSFQVTFERNPQYVSPNFDKIKMAETQF